MRWRSDIIGAKSSRACSIIIMITTNPVLRKCTLTGYDCDGYNALR
jgi:hypothetical protein